MAPDPTVTDAWAPESCPRGEDVELLSALERGEPSAAERVFRRFASAVEARLVGGLAYEREGRRERLPGLRSAFDVEDALLEVFARAFAEIGRWASAGPGVHLDWLAREVMLERLSVQTVDRLVLVDDGARVAPAELPIDARFGRSLDSFRRPLRAQQRVVLELRFEQEQSLVEVGGSTGLMPAAIQALEGEVRAALVRHLERHGELTGPRPVARGLARWLPGGGRCRWSAAVIAELGGELAGPRRLMLRRHVRGCAECRTIWDRASEAERRWLRITRVDRLWSALAPLLRPR